MTRDKEWAALKPQKMIRWFAPPTLVKAAVRALLTATIGKYADRREAQAAFAQGAESYPPEGEQPWDPDGELWIDFVADTGDGFDPTFTVARVMAQDRLPLEGAGSDGKTLETPRGSLVIFGGDQVYPDSKDKQYVNRFQRPFDVAFRHCREAKPKAFTVPGNHDWYDGLSEYLALFCARDEVLKSLETPQRRSYWAIELPQKWWCLGMDWHVDASIDLPQWDFFDDVELKPGDKVILVVASPHWLLRYMGEDGIDAYQTLERFIRDVVEKKGAEVKVVLTGDLHCYSRHELDTHDGKQRQMIMAGGGGAYLYPTHRLPGISHTEVTQKPVPIDGDTLTARAAYPDPALSRKRSGLGWALYQNNPALAFLLLGPMYLIINYLLQGSLAFNFQWAAESGSQPPFWRDALSVILDGQLAGILLCIGLVFGTAKYALMSQSPDDGLPGLAFRGPLAVAAGALHGILHIVLALWIVWLLAGLRGVLDENSLKWVDVCFLIASALLLWIFASPPNIPKALFWGTLVVQLGVLIGRWTGWTSPLIPGMEQTIVLGGWIGVFLLSVYFWATNRFGGHANDVFARQSIESHKNFVRMHIDKEGTLHLYPIGIENVVKHEDWDPSNAPNPVARKDGRSVSELASLIESPLSVS